MFLIISERYLFLYRTHVKIRQLWNVIFCLNENAYFDGVNYVCPDCGREWPCDEIADDDDDNNKLRCPECGSHLVYPDSSGINDYACDARGCRWDGDDDDYDEDYDDDEEED